jgi:hypothetical protein
MTKTGKLRATLDEVVDWTLRHPDVVVQTRISAAPRLMVEVAVRDAEHKLARFTCSVSVGDRPELARAKLDDTLAKVRRETMSVTTRKPRWTLEQWREFVERCHAVRHQLRCAATHAGDIPGMIVKPIDCLVASLCRVEEALVGLETPLERAHGIPPMAFIDAFRDLGGLSEERHLPQPFFGPARKGVLSRWAWGLEARRLGTISLELVRLESELEATTSKAQRLRSVYCLGRARGRVGAARGWFESVYLKHYPDRDDVHTVFLGTGSQEFRPVSFNADGTIDFDDPSIIGPEDMRADRLGP